MRRHTGAGLPRGEAPLRQAPGAKKSGKSIQDPTFFELV
jgi:hypothetical protein